jgi:hypothetical protein
MRRSAIVLGVLLLGAATIRADEVPNLAGSWMLTGIDIGTGERPVLSGYVLNVRQTGTEIMLDSPVGATRRIVKTFTIDPRKTEKSGVTTTISVENQALVVEEKHRSGCLWSSAPATGQRSELTMPNDLANCTARVLRSTYRVSADGMTLEVTKVEAPTGGTGGGGIGGLGGGTRGFTDEDVRSLAERDGRWVFKRQ